MGSEISHAAAIFRAPAFRDIQPANISPGHRAQNVAQRVVHPATSPMALEMIYDRWGRTVHKSVDGQIVSVTL
mgnify:CR=1 FL=1